MPNWEDTFWVWKNPSSDTEDQKCANAERKIREAVRECPVLSNRAIEIIPQGSYRNNTNVRLESDVDICVRCMDVCWSDFDQAPGHSSSSAGLRDSTYTYAQFKNEVGAALIRKFGERGVARGNKAFDVHETTNHVDADVVPAFEHRRYYTDYAGRLTYHSGTEFRPDSGGRIINWPNQQYERGVEKNTATGHRFKHVTRIIKRLRYYMEEKGVAAAKSVPSFLIECLVYNVPNEGFGFPTYTQDLRFALATLFNGTLSDEKCQEWLEVSRLKYLFRSSQPWTRQQAYNFINAAWNFLEAVSKPL